MKIKFSNSGIENFVSAKQIKAMLPWALEAQKLLQSGTGEGAEFTGWLHVQNILRESEMQEVMEAAAKIQSQSEVLVVIGIGGSYLGARAVIEALKPYFCDRTSDRGVEVIFAGQNMSADYMTNLLSYIKDKDFSLNMVSKSGTTTEPGIAFRLLLNLLEQKYGKTAATERVYVTTDQQRGALHDLAVKVGYQRFRVPDDIGGRYSVLTPVGLLPIAAAGIDLAQLLQGAAEAEKCVNQSIENNPALNYAVCRKILADKHYDVELLISYEPALYYLAEWWKQLFGESSGKEKMGIFPAAASFTTDLHSLGQYIQDGRTKLFETTILVEEMANELLVPAGDDADQLSYLEGRSLSYINQMAYRGTKAAHIDGGVPQLSLTLPRRDAESLGEFIYFMEYACAVSCYMDGINPFDQSGVEAYKKNMFKLLGKPGYEKR